MNKQTNINIRTDVEIKKAAENLFEQLGMNMSTAVNIFLRQAIRSGGLPFEVRMDVPNEITARAIEDGRTLLHDKNAKGYKDIDELRTALDM